jgi:CRISPR-associated protein Csy2
MKSIIILNRIKVENANAISGILYGFPAITHFLGFTHSLSRDLNLRLNLGIDGCGVIAHDYQILSHRIGAYGDSVFALTKNPLLKDGKTPSFNEEGKLHMEVSLIFECDFSSDNFAQEINHFEKLIYQLAIKKHLAGGLITEIGSVEFNEIPQKEDDVKFFFKRVLRKLMPGFVLQSRVDILKKYMEENSNTDPLRSILDFYTLKYGCDPNDEKIGKDSKNKWKLLPKPSAGWLVPIQVGYKGISPLYEKNKVSASRDNETPFRFVEPIYGLGEWIGLHRIKDHQTLFWRYHHKDDMYLCLNEINEKK